MNEPCCNDADVTAKTAKEMLAEKDADLAFATARINDLQDEIDRLGAELGAARATVALAIKVGGAMLEQKSKEIARLLAGDQYRAAVIAELQDRLAGTVSLEPMAMAA